MSLVLDDEDNSGNCTRTCTGVNDQFGTNNVNTINNTALILLLVVFCSMHTYERHDACSNKCFTDEQKI
jgi:hypothetical protein